MTAQELLAYRKKSQMSRNEFAALVGQSENAIWRWENNNRRIPRWLPLFLALKDRERNLTMALVMRVEGVTIKKEAAG